MEETEIKPEKANSDQLQCRTCLSVGRKVVPLRKYARVYEKLTCDMVTTCQDINTEDMIICWECEAMLCRLIKFQNQVLRANEALRLGESYIYGTLSNLTTEILHDSHPNTIYIPSIKNKIKDIKNNDLLEDNILENNKIEGPLIQHNVTNDLKTHHDFKAHHNVNDFETKNYNVHNYDIYSDDLQDYDHQNDTLSKTVIKNEPKVEVNKTKRQNRWAKKRALLNKKPKFKIISYKDINLDKLFNKTISCTENVINSTQVCNDNLFNKINILSYTQVRNEKLLSENKINETESYKSVELDRDKKCKNVYRCEKCIIEFDNEKLLIKHIGTWHTKNQNPFICEKCNTCFKTKKRIIKHIKDKIDKYKCLLCEQTCAEKDRYMHLHKCHRKLLQCLKCKLNFGSRREFFQHFKEWHEKFICDHCGVSFKMRYCLKDHIHKQHSPIECKPCNKRFARYNGLWLHNKIAHAKESQPAYCVECDKEYADIYRYRWHLANSARHRPRKRVRIPCPGCDKVFSKNIYMKDHYNLVHLKIYKYRCEECDKNFLRNADLVKHRRRVHEKIAPTKDKICYFCGRGFSTNKILHNHIRTHTGERPHSCRECGACFAQHSALAGHVKALHPSLK